MSETTSMVYIKDTTKGFWGRLTLLHKHYCSQCSDMSDCHVAMRIARAEAQGVNESIGEASGQLTPSFPSPTSVI